MDYPLVNSINNFETLQIPSMEAEDLAVFQKLLEQDISLNTKKALLSDLKHFLAWYASLGEPFRFSRLTVKDIADYKQECATRLKQKPATINRKLVSLRTLCKLAVDLGRLQTNPAEKVKQLPLQSLAPKGLSKPELRRLLKEVELRGNLRDRLIVQMMCGAGFRVSELVNLSPEDVHLGQRKGSVVVRYSKGGKSREVPLNHSIRELMEAYLSQVQPKGQLFTGQRGPLTTIAFNKIIEGYAKKAQIKCSPHTLRHTFAYAYLAQNPGDIVGLAQILGHSNIQTTAIYTQHRLEDLQERVEGII